MMHFDSEVFAWSVAIGGLAELITLKYSSKYDHWAATFQVLLVALVISLMPWGGYAVFGLAAAKAGVVFGKYFRMALERFDYWYTGKKGQWEAIPQIQVEESQDPPMTGSEKI